MIGSIGSLLAFFAIVTLTGCGIGTDAATRLAYDLEAGASRLARDPSARQSVRHHTPSKAGECVGPYTVQLDRVGALIIWCKDASGGTVSSHSTTYHSRYVVTPQTYLLDKPQGSMLTIELENREGRAVIVEVR